MPDLAIVGRVRRAHGIHGELVVEPMTDAAALVFSPGRRVVAGTAAGMPWRDPGTGEEREFAVVSSRPFKDSLLVTVEGISTRTEAERWRGRHLLAPFSALEPPADGEVYLHELEGMRALDAVGAQVGVVSGWYRVPNGILLEVKGGRGTVQVPFNDAFVHDVDRARRCLTVAIPDELWSGGT